MKDTEHLHKILIQQIRPYKVEFKEIYISPYRPETPNDTRKPSPKFVLEAAKKYGIVLATSYVIGDSNSDLEMGYRAGCRSVLVRSGAGAKTEKTPGVKYDFIFDNLLDAAKALV